MFWVAWFHGFQLRLLDYIVVSRSKTVSMAACGLI